MLLILFMQYSPLPIPKANHKGVFVLDKFKVSSSKGKLVRGCKQEAGFYNAWLSEQKYGLQQGSCRPLAAGARSLDFQYELGGWGTGLGQKGATHCSLQGPQCTLSKSLSPICRAKLSFTGLSQRSLYMASG